LNGGVINIFEFRSLTEAAFNKYLAAIAPVLSAGQYYTQVPDPIPSFPQMMIVTTLPDHFAVELVGGRRSNRELKVIKRKLDDEGLYFGQFHYPANTRAVVELNGQNTIKSFAIITKDARQELHRRLPAIADMYPTSLNWVGPGEPPALGFDASANYLHVEDMLLANALNSMVRVRHIRFSLVIAKDTKATDYHAYLDRLLSMVNGAEVVAAQLIPRGKAEKVFGAAQFANIFLMNQLHETSIGTFIDQHREILLSALEGQQLISEPHLTWVVPSPDPNEHAINPDLFVQRADGNWDVYDLKLALLNRKDLTIGERKRRRFVATIEDGIAQLAHYRDFLSIPEHAAQANTKYGVTFNRPRFVLVVGNYENVDAEKIAEARRRFPDLELIDYDSLLLLYLMHENAVPTRAGDQESTPPNTVRIE